MKILSKVAFGGASVLANAVLLGLLVANSLMLAQTRPIVPVVPRKPAPASAKTAAPAKPVAAPAKAAAVTPAKSVAVVPTKQAAIPAHAASSQGRQLINSASGVPAATSKAATQPGSTSMPNTFANQNSLPGTGMAAPLTGQTVPNPVGTPTSAYASPGSTSGDPRAPVAGQGVGTFLWPGGWTLTAYGCFRTGTRLFCDFDTTNQNNVQAGSNIWGLGGGVNLVDDGGKITQRHNAFFVGDDGSQFQTAYISPQPVRFIIEYDDVDQRYTSISLVLARERIQAVPVTPIDPSQPAGRMPARVFASTPAPGPHQAAQPGTNGALDRATQTVNNVSTQKQKAQGFLKSMQGAVQSH